jgi:hypothetical protein
MAFIHHGSGGWRGALRMVLVVGLTAGVVAVPAPASAACGSACDGVNPQTPEGRRSVCLNDAQTVHEEPGVQLRYSPSCRTAWARQTGHLWALTGVLVESYYLNGTRRRVETDRNTGGMPWSRMVNDANLLARACYYEYQTEADQAADRRTIRHCTAKY